MSIRTVPTLSRGGPRTTDHWPQSGHHPSHLFPIPRLGGELPVSLQIHPRVIVFFFSFFGSLVWNLRSSWIRGGTIFFFRCDVLYRPDGLSGITLLCWIVSLFEGRVLLYMLPRRWGRVSFVVVIYCFLKKTYCGSNSEIIQSPDQILFSFLSPWVSPIVYLWCISQSSILLSFHSQSLPLDPLFPTDMDVPSISISHSSRSVFSLSSFRRN